MVDLDLKPIASALQGVREIRTQVNTDAGLGALFPTAAPKSVTRIESFGFTGTLSGRTCKFKLETSKRDEPQVWTLLGGPSSSTIEAYVLFAEDGQSGQVAQIKDGKPEKYYGVSKLA